MSLLLARLVVGVPQVATGGVLPTGPRSPTSLWGTGRVWSKGVGSVHGPYVIHELLMCLTYGPHGGLLKRF